MDQSDHQMSIEYVKFRPLEQEGMLPQLVNCYQQVFADPPWSEWLKCPLCNRHWGAEDRTLVESELHSQHCGVSLQEFWPTETVRSDIINEISGHASCWLALMDGQVIGFCWGYPITPADLANKLALPNLVTVLETQFGLVAHYAYQDDIGVLNAYRGRGIARRSMPGVSRGSKP